MKNLLTLLFFACSIQMFAQDPSGLKRLDLDTTLAPFYHGVASGDPLTDAVIIWTRITIQDTTQANVPVHWEMARDVNFTSMVDSGTVTTGSNRDYTVKIDVTGLQPNTFYYYRFTYDGACSVTGRTKTAPEGMVDQLRFAVVSCSDYREGYFNAYQSIVDRNDVDAVIHLGDYIYEYGGGSPPRTWEPANEIITLSDYRTRFSHYRLDEQLRNLHQQYPFITIWDDHETANNSWVDGAENHTDGAEGAWADRKNNAMQTYFEWMPIRDPSGANPYQGYRKIEYGDLADILVLDTRLEGRDEQTSNGAIINDTNRTLIGADEMTWLKSNLSDTSSQWKIIAQQVMMAPLTLGSFIINNDQWDGYPAERKRFYDHIMNNGIEDVVVLTGDIHTAWANNLIDDGTNVAVEFVTTSVTSSASPIPIDASLLQSTLPHIKFVDLSRKGYYILDVTPDKTQADFYFVNTIDSVDASTYFEEGWYVDSGDRELFQGNETSTTGSFPDLVPATPCYMGPVSVQKPTDELIIIGAYPNPFGESFLVQYYHEKQTEMQVQLIDLAGREVFSKTIITDGGVGYTNVDASGLSAGQYILMLTDGNNVYRKLMVKNPQ